jgi:hypothetical protein
VTPTASFLEYEAGVRYTFASNATIVVKYRDLCIDGVEQQNVSRGQINYSF